MNGVLLREYEIMLNPALGAYSLLFFIKGFISKQSDKQPEITLWHLVTVLPLVFHIVSRKAILKRKGGLRYILNRDPENDIAQNETIFNLTKRIQEMEQRTFRSLKWALTFNLIEIINGYFYSVGKVSIPTSFGQETKDILKASEKLGAWAAESSIFEYLTILGVRP
jgi:hypothetical protein